MVLVEDFPENPFRPTLRYAATQLADLRIACGHNPIKLGSTLAVSRDNNAKSMLSEKSAFSQESLQESRMVFTSSPGGSVSQVSTMRANSRESHMSFSVEGQIGGKLLGAEVRGRYEEHASKSDSDTSATFRSSFQSGRVMFAKAPRLCPEAIDILETAKHPQQAFSEAYGEYYVAAYILGASNVNMLGAQSDVASSSKSIEGQAKVKVLFMSKTVGFSHHESRFEAMAAASLSAYDSLDDWAAHDTVRDAASYSKVLEKASRNGVNGSNIARRVVERMHQLNLVPGQELPWSLCEELFKKGIVCEILLVPYAKLRQYNEALLRGFARGAHSLV